MHEGFFRGVYGVSGDIRGCSGCILCQKRLRLSGKWTSVSLCLRVSRSANGQPSGRNTESFRDDEAVKRRRHDELAVEKELEHPLGGVADALRAEEACACLHLLFHDTCVAPVVVVQ